MSINTTCPTCGSKSRVADEFLGRRVKCPSCGAKYNLPEVMTDDMTVDEEEEEAAPRPRPRSGGKGAATKSGPPAWAWAAVGAVPVLIVAGVLIYVLSDSGSGKSTNLATSAGGGAKAIQTPIGPGPGVQAQAEQPSDDEPTFRMKTSKQWLKQFRDLDPDVRKEAGIALVWLHEKPAIDGLLADMKGKKDPLAAYFLGAMGPNAKEALVPLSEFRKELEEEGKDPKKWAAIGDLYEKVLWAIMRIDGLYPDDMDPNREARLIHIAKTNSDAGFRYVALRGLQQTRPNWTAVPEPIFEALEWIQKNEKDTTVKNYAAQVHRYLLPYRAKKPSPETPKSNDAVKELSLLAGVWEVVSVEKDGKKLPAETVKAWKLVVNGKEYKLEAGQDSVQGEYKLDPNKVPKQIDALRTAGMDKSKTLLGIYKLEGDVLTMCYNQPGKDKRPTEFASKADSGLSLYVFKRPKTETKKE